MLQPNTKNLPKCMVITTTKTEKIIMKVDTVEKVVVKVKNSGKLSWTKKFKVNILPKKLKK